MDKASINLIFLLVIVLTLDYVESLPPSHSLPQSTVGRKLLTQTRRRKEDLWDNVVDAVRDIGHQLKDAIYDDGVNRHNPGQGTLRAEPYITQDKITNFFNGLRLAFLKPWYPFKKIKKISD